MGRPETLVWHYTSAEGFENIVRSNTLWATQMSGLNDVSELAFGCDNVANACEQFAQSGERSIGDQEWLRSVRAWFVPEDARDLVFVTSASLVDDSLNQWMHYGASGYSIGIDPQVELGYRNPNGSVAPSEPGLTHAAGWTNVRYGDDSALVGDAIKAMLAARNSDDVTWNEWSQLSVLRTLAASQKHPAFADERESRYIVSMPLDSQARMYRTSRAGRLVAYVHLAALTPDSNHGSDSIRLPIREVKIGPPTTRQMEEKTVQRFLADHGYTNVKVSVSEIPYRP